MNRKGITLVEILIVIGIIAIIGSIVYPILFMSNQRVSKELEDSFERNEIREITNFLKEDIRYSHDIDFTDLGEPVKFTSSINYPTGDPVIYTRAMGEDGSYHVVRRFEGNDLHFPMIEDAKIYDLIQNPDLVQVKLYIKSDIPEERLYEYKIARWRWQLAKESEATFFDFIENENLFIFGAGFKMAGSSVTGSGATIFVDSDLLSSDLNGHANIGVSNAYIKGNVSLNASQKLGLESNPGNLIIGGNVNITGSSVIYGDVYIQGNLTLSGSAKIVGNVYLQGDFDFNNGYIEGNVYVNKNLRLTNGRLETGKIYVNQNVTVNWSPTINSGSGVYYYGTISHPASLGIPRFYKIDSPVPVAEKTIPALGIPRPKEEQWYADNGYDLNGGLASGAKIYVSSGDYIRTTAGTVSNVIVVNLGGNIKISGGNLNLSGVIYAPYGSVEIAGRSFTGLVIAASGADMSAGGMNVVFAGIETYISNANQYPFLNEMMP